MDRLKMVASINGPSPMIGYTSTVYIGSVCLCRLGVGGHLLVNHQSNDQLQKILPWDYPLSFPAL